jgi:(E)-4-hydroxy-3-methylbut-2-enyl-diphosphate synthase
VDVTASPLSPRRKTRQIAVGSVKVGGDAPISVQSMTTTKTADVEGTLEQIYALAAEGADIVRCTCNEVAAAEGLAQIIPRSPVPIVADIHFHVEMALAALEAGVQGLRLNPGNLRKPEEIKLVASEARDRGVPIRIGVNAGSLHPDIYERFGGATPEALVESARLELAYFEEVDFNDVKISVKASSVATMIAAYRLASETFDHPLHLGVTEAGPLPSGLLKGTAGIGTLLAEGIGDTLRYSLTADPVEEARAGRTLLEVLGLRERKGLDLIACPSCGRAEVDVIKIANEAQAALSLLNLPIQVAVMGCVVNGPGEARHADLGIAAGRSAGTCSSRDRSCVSSKRTRWSRRSSKRRPRSSPRVSKRGSPRATRAPRPRPRPTARCCSMTAAPTRTTRVSASRRSVDASKDKLLF